MSFVRYCIREGDEVSERELGAADAAYHHDGTIVVSLAFNDGNGGEGFVSANLAIIDAFSLLEELKEAVHCVVDRINGQN